MNTRWKTQRANFEEKGKVYLVRCPDCGRENYTMMVASGQCAWCNYSTEAEEIIDANK